MAQKTARERFKDFRTKRGLSIRVAGRELGVSHVTILAWEAGRAIPTGPLRDVIQKWTGNRVKASSWPPSKHESLVQQKAADFLKRNGTDG